MRRKTILLVDDEYVAQAMVEDILTAEGYTVVSATTASDALVAADREHPDLLLLDVILPDLDGISLLKALRSRPATAATPVILLSALSRVPSLPPRETAAFIRKPIVPEEILAAVRRALGEE